MFMLDQVRHVKYSTAVAVIKNTLYIHIYCFSALVLTMSITDHAECLNNKIEIRYSINRLIEIMTLRVTLAISV